MSAPVRGQGCTLALGLGLCGLASSIWRGCGEEMAVKADAVEVEVVGGVKTQAAEKLSVDSDDREVVVDQ